MATQNPQSLSTTGPATLHMSLSPTFSSRAASDSQQQQHQHQQQGQTRMHMSNSTLDEFARLRALPSDGAMMEHSYVEDSVSNPAAFLSGMMDGPSINQPPSLSHIHPTAKIHELSFATLNHHQIQRLSHLEIVNRSYYHMNSREPVEYGLLDRRMGTSEKLRGKECRTCGKSLAECVGHFGHIRLCLPCFHIGFFKEVIHILQCICKSCGKILLNSRERGSFLVAMRAAKKENDRRKRTNIHVDIFTSCKKKKKCLGCGAMNGVVKKINGVYRIIHEYRGKDFQPGREAFVESFGPAGQWNKQLKDYIRHAQIDLDPLKVLKLFEKISAEDCELLNFDSTKSHPSSLIVTSILVPPMAIRPSVSMGTGGSNEDDLTMKLGDVVQINEHLKKLLAQGMPTSSIADNWSFLQAQIAMYINADLPGFPKEISSAGKHLRALTQRLKGKQGRFRGNLSGKRVDFSSRTVISPDPNLGIDEVGVPERVAKILTFPERVTAMNYKRLRQAVLNGEDQHPGAAQIEHANGVRISLRYGDRKRAALALKYGDIVERHLRDGDVVLFNRQPSLHKLSIMAHRARVLKWRTFRFNECVCPPYNADFDGDEMNLHLPQTEEARAEALTLMATVENLVTPRHGEPLITLVQDFLTTSYLITQRDVFYDKAEFCRICCYFNDALEHIHLPPPTIVKPVRLWTGKQIISLLLRPNKDPKWPLVNVECKSKSMTNASIPYKCPMDGYVVIRNSELILGSLDKGTMGGDKNGVLYALIRMFSSQTAAMVMNRFAKLSGRWITNRGFSIGIDDVTPSANVLKKKRALIDKGYNDCNDNIDKFNKGTLPPQSGCNEEQTLEALLNGTLSKLRDDAGGICKQELDIHHNSPLIMAVCGSKGSNINIAQMVACVGQQSVSGHRIPNGFLNRTLPHFPKHSREPAAKGFVQNSFYSGLTATEFFFHTMGGREGLVDTAVKTAETGYMQRRLMKALEDLCINYDGTVRSSTRGIVQFTYGDDGLDPAQQGQGAPVMFNRLYEQIRATMKDDKSETMEPNKLRERFTSVLSSKHFTVCSDQFLNMTKEFLESRVKEIERLANTLVKDKSSTKQQKKWIVESTHRLTEQQLLSFLHQCRERYLLAKMEAGTAVGALAAQSIGEPGTQMTLKTFHFAGVASMNVTLGVPRIKEIINASKTINTPIITAPLENDKEETAARIVKGRIEKTTLGEIAAFIEEVFTPADCFVAVRLDYAVLDRLQISLSAEDVRKACIQSKHVKPLKMKFEHIKILSADILHFHPTDDSKEGMMFSIQKIKNALPAVVVTGIASINRAIITKNEKDEKLKLLVEGQDLRGVMATVGVKGLECYSNHPLEMERVLGIEAARKSIMDEIHSTMQSHGLTIDPRHVSLLADIMSYRGEILGITRFGIAKMKDNALMLASFEKTTDHLFEAAVRGAEDEIAGVSESIIMGQPVPIGTGLFSLVYNANPQTNAQIRRPNLLLHAPPLLANGNEQRNHR